MTTNPQVDAHIAKAQPFARPILEHIRKLMHRALPDVEEEIKWGHPFFTLNGKIIGNLAAFKEHCSFGLWSKEVVALAKKDGVAQSGSGMGSFGKLKTLKDLPPDKTLLRYIATAAASIQAGESIIRNRPKVVKSEIAMPAAFAAALKKSKTAAANFKTFSASAQREYIEWIADAKREETRTTRIATAIDWIAEGKQRNWKYQK